MKNLINMKYYIITDFIYEFGIINGKFLICHYKRSDLILLFCFNLINIDKTFIFVKFLFVLVCFIETLLLFFYNVLSKFEFKPHSQKFMKTKRRRIFKFQVK